MNFFLPSSLVTLTLTLVVTLTWSMPTEEYMKVRGQMLEADRRSQLGHKLVLSADEKIVSDLMVKEKATMIENSRQGGQDYFPSFSFYRSKPLMEKTKVFRLIKQMPKGAALHLHDQSITSTDWLVKNVTYRDNAYMCHNKKIHAMQFRFFKVPPTDNPDCSWMSVRKARSLASSINDFDDSIIKNISLLTSDPLVNYPTVNKVWARFNKFFEQVAGLIFYEPVFADYFRQALVEFDADNVQYIELRGLFGGVYDLEGKVYGMEKALDIYAQVTKEFVQSHPGFSGAKFIMSGIRNFDKNVILQEIKDTIAMRQKYPDLLLGYDLVGQEDPYNSLLHYRDDLLYPSQQTPAINMPFFFHAGETNWQGSETDYNLIDAVLLNTTRIGHGYGLIKHPSLVKAVREKGIAVEVNPISNQLLGLIQDPRNHAIVPLMADDFPVVISSDDPTSWDADPLSHDFYVAFMTMCGEDDDLRFLKQLAINSIKYSAMSDSEKQAALTLWQSKWDTFIQQAVQSAHTVYY